MHGGRKDVCGCAGTASFALGVFFPRPDMFVCAFIVHCPSTIGLGLSYLPISVVCTTCTYRMHLPGDCPPPPAA